MKTYPLLMMGVLVLITLGLGGCSSDAGGENRHDAGSGAGGNGVGGAGAGGSGGMGGRVDAGVGGELGVACGSMTCTGSSFCYAAVSGFGTADASTAESCRSATTCASNADCTCYCMQAGCPSNVIVNGRCICSSPQVRTATCYLF